jgi:Zn-dependent protease with chaperone function
MTHVRSSRTLGWLYLACTAVRVAVSVGVLLAALGWLGCWSAVVVAGWLATTPILWTVRGERGFLRLGRGLRAIPGVDEVMIFSGVTARCNLPADRIDWYVRSRDDAINAYAAGRRSIAVSGGLLQACTAGEISVDEAVGILAHEIGHLVDPTSRRRPAVAWLTWPWWLLQVSLARMVRALARRAPAGAASLLLLPVVAVVAVVQLVPSRAWAPLLGIVAIAVAVGVMPLIDAAASRDAELVADDYVARVGSAEHLATVLGRIERAPGSRVGRLYAHHPPVSLRVARLTSAH